MKRHLDRLTIPAWYPGDVDVSTYDLADRLGNLRYDCLADYLLALAEKLRRDAEADRGCGRPVLADHLAASSWNLLDAARAIRYAWDVCESHMEDG
jgi:hypothetical protein